MELLISYSQFNEDIIMMKALKEVEPEKIFYIDVGANDAVEDSVTYLFYLMGGHGINIEPQEGYRRRYERLRLNDSTLYVGVGSENGEMEIYGNGQSATLNKEGKYDTSQKQKVKIVTLESVCKKFDLGKKDIHFLKIDVEGFEKQVLEGMNFDKYRPWILCIESFEPGGKKRTFEKWESLITDKGYRFAYEYGVNRFYCAEEQENVYERLKNSDDIMQNYKVMKMNDYKERYEELIGSKAYRIVVFIQKTHSFIKGMILKGKNK